MSPSLLPYPKQDNAKKNPQAIDNNDEAKFKGPDIVNAIDNETFYYLLAYVGIRIIQLNRISNTGTTVENIKKKEE